MRSSRSRRRPARHVSVRRRARRGEPAAGWLCCAEWTWRRLPGKVGRGRGADGLVWLVDGVGSAMGGRRACCWLLFRSAGNCRALALDDTRRRGCAPWRGLHCGCTDSRLCCVLTVIGSTRGAYMRRYGARRVASAATHDERVCQGLLLAGMPQVRPHMRRDGPMCCFIARRLLPPSSLPSFSTGRRLSWLAS